MTSNICGPSEGRFNSGSQTLIDGDASRAAALFVALSRSVEIAQPFFARKDVRRDCALHTLSRIDRIFVTLPMAELRDFQCHIPVRLAIECRRKQQDHPAMW